MEADGVVPELRQRIRVDADEDEGDDDRPRQRGQRGPGADPTLPREDDQRDEHGQREELDRDARRGHGARGCGSPDGSPVEPPGRDRECREGERDRGDVRGHAGRLGRIRRRCDHQRSGGDSAREPGEPPPDQVGRRDADEPHHQHSDPQPLHGTSGEQADRPEEEVEPGRLRGEDVAAELLPVAERVEARQIDALVVVRASVETVRAEACGGGEERPDRHHVPPPEHVL